MQFRIGFQENFFFERGVEAFLNFTDHKLSVMKVMVWSFFGHMMLATMFIVSGSILIPEMSPLTTSILALLGMLANSLPITPGGLGIGEAAFEGIFLLGGYAGGAQLILAWRIGMLPLCLLGSLLYMFGVKNFFCKLRGIQELEIRFEFFEIILMFEILQNHFSYDLVLQSGPQIPTIPQLAFPPTPASLPETLDISSMLQCRSMSEALRQDKPGRNDRKISICLSITLCVSTSYPYCSVTGDQ